MAALNFDANHNLVGMMTDPVGKSHQVFYSGIVGLRNCKLAYAFGTNPVIYENWIRDFWTHARRVGNTIVSVVRGVDVVIDEQCVREALHFPDSSNDPIEIDDDTIRGILRRMSYEPTYPPTKKKFLHPYWRFIFHYFVACISGRKGGVDQISRENTAAVVSLSDNRNFN